MHICMPMNEGIPDKLSQSQPICLQTHRLECFGKLHSELTSQNTQLSGESTSLGGSNTFIVSIR